MPFAPSHEPHRRAAIPLRRILTAFLLAGALFVLPACGSDSSADISAGGSAGPTSSAAKQKLAKTRFVANAGLAAGATYQWIVKPYRNGKFKKGADGRTFALVKAGLAGAFAYNRLKHSRRSPARSTSSRTCRPSSSTATRRPMSSRATRTPSTT